MLAEGERPVLALASSFQVSLPAVSQHLAVLRDAGLVGERRDGRQRVYHLTPEPLQEVSEWIALYERFWKQKLKALGAFLERHVGRRPARKAVPLKSEPRARRKARR